MMTTTICRRFTFEACHSLKWHKGLCSQPHGHSYKLFVYLRGETNNDGVVMDFGDLKTLVKKNIIDVLDHSDLNGIFKSPTAEVMARSILLQLKKLDQRVFKVRLYETENNYAEVVSL